MTLLSLIQELVAFLPRIRRFVKVDYACRELQNHENKVESIYVGEENWRVPGHVGFQVEAYVGIFSYRLANELVLNLVEITKPTLDNDQHCINLDHQCDTSLQAEYPAAIFADFIPIFWVILWPFSYQLLMLCLAHWIGRTFKTSVTYIILLLLLWWRGDAAFVRFVE